MTEQQKRLIDKILKASNIRNRSYRRGTASYIKISPTAYIRKYKINRIFNEED